MAATNLLQFRQGPLPALRNRLIRSIFQQHHREAAGRRRDARNHLFSARDFSLTIEIRPARPADLAIVHGLIRSLAEYEELTHLCVASEADLARELFGTEPAAEVLLAVADGEVAGFALFFHNFSTFLGRRGIWLEDLFVQPPYRRRGCARALLRAIAAIARERGCGRFEWSVLDWNEPAIRFYEALGATVLPDWRIVRVAGAALERFGTEPSAGRAGGSGS
jgi:GNAT superfamily N-acetyltransferase